MTGDPNRVVIARRARRLAPAVVAVAVAVAVAAASTSAAASQNTGAPNKVITPLLPPTDAFEQPSLATDPAHPTHLAMAYREGSKLSECYLARSTDSGSTWKSMALVGSQGGAALPPGASHCDNPKVAFGPAGSLYYVFQDTGFRRTEPTALNSFIMASADGGGHFGAPQMLAPSDMANDWYPDVVADQKTGRVYVAWSRYGINFTVFPGVILVESSTDRAKTFSAPTQIEPPKAPQNVGGPFMSVGADGKLYLSYLPGQVATGGMFVPTTDTMQVAVSSDAGRTFTDRPVAEIAKAARGSGKLTPSFNNQAVATGNSSGLAYVSWWDDRGPDGLPRIAFSSTTNGGQSWASPRTLAPPPGIGASEQLSSPWISVAPNGRIDLAYYGLTPDGIQNVYRSSSTDRGATFAAPVKLNAQPSLAKVGPSAGGRLTATFGDYLAVSAADQRSVVAWTDSSRGNLTTGHQDIFVAVKQMGGGGLSLWVFVLIGGGVVVLLVVVVAAGRRFRKAGVEREGTAT